ncbi:MAG: FKBP-type peptidyl-prolyl cis-trans isomerase [Bacteroidales bacterium]|nr:FKBP-type peptidyl-prolyl cis-trans isomerase [Bacteroidales bacterium]
MNRVLYIIGIFLLFTTYSCESEDTPEEKRAEELIELESFIAENYPDATLTESGLYIVWNRHGTGQAVSFGDYVNVIYTGKFLDGYVFDASSYHNGTFQFYVGAGNVILAWDEALQLCKVGDKITIITPSTLAYGTYGSSEIPGYASLVFDIEVIEIFNK